MEQTNNHRHQTIEHVEVEHELHALERFGHIKLEIEREQRNGDAHDCVAEKDKPLKTEFLFLVIFHVLISRIWLKLQRVSGSF